MIYSLDIVEDTDVITFNAADMEFSDASILDHAGARHEQIQRSGDEKQEHVSFHFSQEFKKGTSVKLNVGWQAKLGQTMVGWSSITRLSTVVSLSFMQ